MKKIILFSLLALTACKKDENKPQTATTTYTVQFVTFQPDNHVSSMGNNYNDPLPTFYLKSGESAHYTCDSPLNKTVAIVVNGKEIDRKSASKPEILSYTYFAK